ncbi:MAG: hypothetical protein ABEH90_11445 [Halolamina sp.]
MTAERTGNHDDSEEVPAAARPPPDEVVRATRVEDDELLLWAAESEGAWVQSDTVVTLSDGSER